MGIALLISKDGNHRSLPPGRYACELIKEDSGQWRFSRRTSFMTTTTRLTGSIAGERRHYQSAIEPVVALLAANAQTQTYNP